MSGNPGDVVEYDSRQGPPVEQRDLLPAGPAPHATLIGQDGRKLVMARTASGEVSLTIAGREPLMLDKFQSIAFAAAASSLMEG